MTVNGDVGFRNGKSGAIYTFTKIAGGTGGLSFATWSTCTSVAYGFTTLDADNYTGTIALDGDVLTFNVGDILKTGAEPGDKVLPLAVSNNATVNLSGATLNGAAANLVLKSDGVYVLLPVAYTVTVQKIYDDPTDPYSPYTEVVTTNEFETINEAIATNPSKIYLVDSSIAAPEGWEKSLENEIYVLTPIPPVAYVDGMTSECGYIDFSDALSAALTSGSHQLYIVSSQAIETLTVPDGCVLTLSVPSAKGGELDVSNIVVAAGASLQMATAVEAEYSVSGALELKIGDFTGSSVDLAAVGATCTVRSGVTAPTVTTSVANYEVRNNGGEYSVREDMGWLYEADGYQNYTGGWSNDVVYSEGKVHIEDGNTYIADKPSAGQLVTVAMTLSFDDANDEDEDVGDAKAAVRLASGQDEGTYQFQLYTTNELGAAAWANATVAGVTATTNVDYTFVFVLDLTNKVYTASIVDGATTNAFSVGESDKIPFAYQGTVTPVQQIEFIGAGTVTSIQGSYEDVSAPAEEFDPNEEVTINGSSVTLTSDQADWLNACAGTKAAKDQILAGLDATAFNNAYLLNLDITNPAYDGTFTFEVTDFDVGDTTVTVKVTLTRSGEIEGPINGTLKLTGTDALGNAFEVKGSSTITDAHFSTGDGEVTISFPKDADTKFFQPVIE